jgi:hypothetical protein
MILCTLTLTVNHGLPLLDRHLDPIFSSSKSDKESGS